MTVATNDLPVQFSSTRRRRTADTIAPRLRGVDSVARALCLVLTSPFGRLVGRERG